MKRSPGPGPTPGNGPGIQDLIRNIWITPDTGRIDVKAHMAVSGQIVHAHLSDTVSLRDSTEAIASQPLGSPHALIVTPPNFLLQASLILGEKTSEGHIIEAVAVPWFKIVKMIGEDPSFLESLNARLAEEIVAGAYKELGYDVTLTQRSGDFGRDVIATNESLSISYYDQVKFFKPGNLVTAHDVRTMHAVIAGFPNVSKVFVTTTSDFAPGVWTDPTIAPFMPYRIDLRPREKLIELLTTAAANRAKAYQK